MKPRLIVFDLDGTLVDSQRDLAEAANELIAAYGASPLEEAAIGRMVGAGAAALVTRALAAAGITPPPAEALERFLAIYDGRLLNHTRPYPGIPELLERAAPAAPLAVLTNKPEKASARILENLGLASFFAEISTDDGVHPRKPSPEGLVHLISRWGATAATTLLVGDSEIDFQTAENAGTAFCLARYGFGYLTFPRERLRGTELVIDSPDELGALLDLRVAPASQEG